MLLQRAAASGKSACRPSHASARALVLGAPRRCATATRRSPARIAAEPKQRDQAGAPPATPTEELPPWVKSERERALQAAAPKQLPWPLYLLFSSFVAIASVGSIFEYFNHNALFGVLPADSALWAPVVGLFALTGLPTAGVLFFKGVQAANEAAERQDRIDGYLD